MATEDSIPQSSSPHLLVYIPDGVVSRQPSRIQRIIGECQLHHFELAYHNVSLVSGQSPEDAFWLDMRLNLDSLIVDDLRQQAQAGTS